MMKVTIALDHQWLALAVLQQLSFHSCGELAMSQLH
jgi:hypothetical protein